MTELAVSWPAILSILGGILAVALIRWVWRFRGRPGATYWMGVQAIIGLYALSYGVGLLVFDPTLRPAVDPLLWVARSWAGPTILLFALAYTGRERFATRRIAAVLYGFWTVPVALYLTNPLHHLWWTGYRIAPVFGAAAVDFEPGIGLYFFAVMAWVFTGVGVLVLLEPLVNYRRLFGRQALAVAAVVGLPTAANVVWLFRLGPTAHLDLTVIMFPISSAAMSYALFREELFEVLPATTRVADDIALDDVTTAVLTVSPTGRLIDFNAAAADLIDGDRSAAVGRPMDDVLAVDLPLERAEFSVSDPAGRNREYDADVSPITSRTGDPMGYVATFHDVTEKHRRQQRLAVQNRILRHNLRNGLTVVEGSAERIEQVAADGEVESLVENILGRSGELLEISGKARRFDTALSDPPERIDVAEVCRAVVEETREQYPGATVEFEAATEARIEGRKRLLGQVLGEAVENGVVHGGDDPRVRVRLRGGPDGGVRIRIEDDGPGIPDDELAALRSGEEDPLSHGSSIGLWVVEWGVSVLGGSVTFEPDDDGTTVTIDLPAE